jgi:hypothetical protein
LDFVEIVIFEEESRLVLIGELCDEGSEVAEIVEFHVESQFWSNSAYPSANRMNG